MRMRLLVAGFAVLALAGCAGTPAALVASTRHHQRPAHVATLSASGQRGASLAVLSGAASVTVSAASMPGVLVRAWTPANSGIRPELVNVDGTVQVYLASTGNSGPAVVWIRVSSAVRWRLQFSGGASQTSVQMGNGQLTGIDFSAGSSLITMGLPRPAGTVTITLAGGASQVNVAMPAGVAARLQLFGGSSVAVLGGQTYTGIAGGTVLTGPGWGTAAHRYDFAAPAGVSQITVSG
jgi:hypothetical protein